MKVHELMTRMTGKDPNAEVRMEILRDDLVALGWMPPGSRTIPADPEWDHARDAWEGVPRAEWENATPAIRAALDSLGALLATYDGYGEEPEVR